MSKQCDGANVDRTFGALTLLAASLGAFTVATALRGITLRRKLETALADSRELRRSLEETAIVRHDFRKHMNIVRSMLADGHGDRAMAYLDKLSDMTERALEGTAFTGNYMVDMILNSRLAQARREGVRICVTAARVPETLRISDDTLSALLCNAIDNAVAAAKADGEKTGWINIDLHGKGEMLYIGIANSCSDAADPGKSRRKGYGQRIMQRIVEQYHGVMETENLGGSYRLSFVLPVIA